VKPGEKLSPQALEPALVAPCGMNCGLCMGYLRDKNRCLGRDVFPCPRLKRLDTRYRTKYRMSMLESLRAIRDLGIEAFVESERGRWECSKCGGLRCVHTAECIYCANVWPRPPAA
jgi:hypothetical protein